MALSATELTWLEEFLMAADESKALTPWERGFVDDQQRSLTEYDDAMNLSKKQWAILRRVAGKIGHDVADAGEC